MRDKNPNDSRELTDVENGGSVNARYGNVEIPPGVPRVFVSNYEQPFLDPESSVYDRRVKSAKIAHQNDKAMDHFF
jgi:hypothetical protein